MHATVAVRPCLCIERATWEISLYTSLCDSSGKKGPFPGVDGDMCICRKLERGRCVSKCFGTPFTLADSVLERETKQFLYNLVAVIAVFV
jgi:hypothetical protein